MVNYGGGECLNSILHVVQSLIYARSTDEVSALVLDIGTSSIRAGYAGDDTPKAIIPTAYGFKEEAALDEDVTMGEAGEENGDAGKKPEKKIKLYIGQNGPSVWREDMQIANPVHNGLSTFSWTIACSP